MLSEVVFRLDAGKKVGLGHLSRCISLADEFVSDYDIRFIIRTDDQNFIQSVVENKGLSGVYRNFLFIDDYTSIKEELDTIINEISEDSLLIIDHYLADKEYQLYLRDHNVRWLQFDSHAKNELYGDFVLHASPGATSELYQPLIKNDNATAFLGTKYVMINEIFSKMRELAKPRQSIKNIFMSFGGGDDQGAILKCIHFLDYKTLGNVKLKIFTSDKNPSLQEISKEVKNIEQVELIVNCNEIANEMLISDLAILSPGTLSYEAACMGLPMLIITTADNQYINANGWDKLKCGINLGHVNNFNKNDLNTEIQNLINNPNILNDMSLNCLESVDGKGPKRVTKIIKSKL
ncbi:UDP-2,4-diacetamido-2,4,6-trideoxy-beta-L-altropyranose hydrolase [Marinifilum fragile]|uniref:UDP-2,4-diacetamido-2,4, 6-trideoxy-beta-L-altropyranose hydrolase n=1 Tax=Marinifilum fragile TaxID=570161 RepID=UPI002AA664F2|nr:UDP-2,4-diacetamido-2,4,6-trideoxy-beta-L-altropyranose hydrolase [Marinifilum fragile]